MAFKYSVVFVNNASGTLSLAIPGNPLNWEELTGSCDEETLEKIRSFASSTHSTVAVSNRIHWNSMEDLELKEPSPLEKLWIRNLTDVPKDDECAGNWKISGESIMMAEEWEEPLPAPETPETVEQTEKESSAEETVAAAENPSDAAGEAAAPAEESAEITENAALSIEEVEKSAEMPEKPVDINKTQCPVQSSDGKKSATAKEVSKILSGIAIALGTVSAVYLYLKKNRK